MNQLYMPNNWIDQVDPYNNQLDRLNNWSMHYWHSLYQHHIMYKWKHLDWTYMFLPNMPHKWFDQLELVHNQLDMLYN